MKAKPYNCHSNYCSASVQQPTATSKYALNNTMTTTTLLISLPRWMIMQAKYSLIQVYHPKFSLGTPLQSHRGLDSWGSWEWNQK